MLPCVPLPMPKHHFTWRDAHEVAPLATSGGHDTRMTRSSLVAFTMIQANYFYDITLLGAVHAVFLAPSQPLLCWPAPRPIPRRSPGRKTCTASSVQDLGNSGQFLPGKFFNTDVARRVVRPLKPLAQFLVSIAVNRDLSLHDPPRTPAGTPLAK
jgi:hypothetical protein